MSTANQNNVKKTNGGGGGSTGNSMTNTPSSTPVSAVVNTSNGGQAPQSTTPPNNAPKYGTLIPNRIFVGGISANTTETELLQLFSNYGTVKAAKIIQDRAGVSRGYGFITFESEEEAKRLQREADNIVLRERKLNIAPAIKKQPFSRAFDAPSPSTIAPGAPAPYFLQAGGVPFYQGGVTYYPQPAPAGEPSTPQPPVYQPQTIYPTQTGPPQTAAYPPMIYPTQPLYMPQQFPYQPVPYEYNYYTSGGQQYLVGGQGASQLPAATATPLQPPGSPPRTPCFGPQLPYAADAALYYGVPVYSPAEGAALYQDALDMANGNLAEETVYAYEEEVPSHDLPSPGLAFSASSVGTAPSEHDRASPSEVDTARQSATPVVSLLSLDQHQEKDLVEMRGGRRLQRSFEPAPPPPPPSSSSGTNSNSSDSNCSTNARNGYITVTSSLSNGYSSVALSQAVPRGCPSHEPPPSKYKNAAPTVASRGYRAWYSRRRPSGDNSDRHRPTDGEFRSVDENRNEEKGVCRNAGDGGGGGTASPPAPFSSFPQSAVPAKYNTYSFYGNYSGGGRTTARTNYYNPGYNNRSQYGVQYNHKLVYGPSRGVEGFAARKPYLSNNGRSRNVYDYCDAHHHNNTLGSRDGTAPPDLTSFPFPPQMVPPGSQNFVPPSRARNRRSNNVRRSGGHPAGPGAPPSEIGAGDAPLPSQGVADACKKIENLKL